MREERTTISADLVGSLIYVGWGWCNLGYSSLRRFDDGGSWGSHGFPDRFDRRLVIGYARMLLLGCSSRSWGVTDHIDIHRDG